jgi:anti-sigma factor RsiW
MITRDNYEEFFLLYTDNELSASERQNVERFVADHPDLREEWEAFLQCRVSPDTHLAFPDREALLREPLLYYVDGLPFLHPDNSIVFPDKDRLYRTAKDRRVIPLPWLRAGIAAAIIAAAALVFLLTGRQQPATNTSVAVHPPANRSVAAQRPASENVTKPSNTKVLSDVTSTPAPALHIVEGKPKTNERPSVRKPIQRQPDQQKDLTVSGNPSRGPTVARNTSDPRKGVNQRVSTDQHVPDISVGDMPATGSLASDVHLAVQTDIPKDQSSFATQALQEEQTGTGRENEFGTDLQAAPAKTKLRGIFRKVTRAFAKTADRDNDGNRQVLVGAFQVTLN